MNRNKWMQNGLITPQTRTRTGIAVCGLAAAALLLTGCGDDEPKAQPSTAPGGTSAASTPSASASPSVSPTGSPSTGLTEDQAERRQLVPAAKVDYRKAATAAEGKVSGGKLVSAELKRTREGRPEWATEVAAVDGTVHKVTVDAVGGRAAAPRADSDQDAEDKKKLAARLAKAEMNWEKAATTATGRKNGTVTAVELDDDDKAGGKLVWKVDVVTPGNWDKTTYDVDAADGKVVREHVDRD